MQYLLQHLQANDLNEQTNFFKPDLKKKIPKR